MESLHDELRQRLALGRLGLEVFKLNEAVDQAAADGSLDWADVERLIDLLDQFTEALLQRGGARDVALAGANRRHLARLAQIRALYDAEHG